MWRGLLLVCLVGCPGPTDPTQPDSGPPTDGNGDADPGESRLIIAWATTPSSPGTTAAGNQLEDIKFRMESLKAIVDVDPNDPNTTQETYRLHWDDESMPESIEFGNAPAGRYTSIVLQLDDGDGEKAFDLRGDASDGASFKIDDSSSLSISMSCNATLAPGSEMTIVIDIDLQSAIDPIDFDSLPADDGVDHHLDSETAAEAMAQFRTRLQQAFRVRTGGE